ncbi:MAG: DMT family transporter [Alphaproteobacteria bacterium]|nr:DMT family transporter [Alphaproteobacteria bacterium]
MRTAHALHPHKPSQIKGILFMCAAILNYSIMDALVKYLTQDYPVLMVSFFRFFFAFIPVLILIRLDGGMNALTTKRPVLHLMRALFGMAAFVSFFFGLQQLELADAVALGFTTPLFLTALSVPVLGEKVGPRRWAAVIVGFIGVLVIAQPGTSVFQMASLLPILAGFFLACTLITVKLMARTETNAMMLFSVTVIGTLITASIQPFVWVTPAWEDLFWLILVGLIGGYGQYLVANAFRNADAVVIAPFDYTAIIWATILGYLLFGDLPGLPVVIGCGVIVASGIYIIYRENQVRRAALKS